MRVGIFILLGVVFFLAVMFLSTTLLQVILVDEPDLLVESDDVRGSGVIYRDVPYTLGFGQQNLIVAALNSMEEVEEPEGFEEGKDLPFDELIIYHFDTPDDHITGKELDGRIVLLFKTDSYERYLLDKSRGEFLQVLKQAYQP